MGRARLPWFKVQSRLTSHPKFRKLSSNQRGNILSLWCCASDQAERGKLPSLPEIAYHLGISYIKNPARVRAVLVEFTGIGLLDYDEATGVYRVHDWEFWQDNLSNSPQSVPQSVPQFGPQSVEGVDENKEVTAELDVPRKIEVQNQLLLRNNCSQDDKVTRKVRERHTIQDERYSPVKSFMEAQYQEWRGRSLGADTLAKDWVRFAAMLHRTCNDPAYTVNGIQAAFLRWVSSGKQYDKSMSIAQWADSIHRYMGSNGSTHTGTSTQDKSPAGRVPIADRDDADLEWWKA